MLRLSNRLVLGCIGMLMLNVSCTRQKDVSVNVGAVLPLTGGIAQFGNYWRQGLELALASAVKQGLIRDGDVKLIVEDGQADPRRSVDAFNKLTTVNRVVACVVGTSGVTLAIKPLANRQHIVLLNASAISTDIEDAADYVFSVIPNAAHTGRFLADMAYQRLGKRNAGILFRNDPSGESFRKYFAERFKALGGRVSYEDAHPKDASDFKAQLAKLATLPDLDVLFVASWGTDAAYYVKQAKEMGVTIPVITYESFYTPKVLEIAGNAAEGVIFSAPAFGSDTNNTQLVALKQQLKTRYGHEELNYHVAGHYDAMMFLLSAIAQGNRTPERIRDYMSRVKFFDGVTGRIEFDAFGGAAIPLRLYTVKNGAFVPY